MLLRWVPSILALVLVWASVPVALGDMDRCQGPLFKQEEGLCKCIASKRVVNVWNSDRFSQEERECRLLDEFQKRCRSNQIPEVLYVKNSRCYCEYSKKFLGPREEEFNEFSDEVILKQVDNGITVCKKDHHYFQQVTGSSTGPLLRYLALHPYLNRESLNPSARTVRKVSERDGRIPGGKKYIFELMPGFDRFHDHQEGTSPQGSLASLEILLSGGIGRIFNSLVLGKTVQVTNVAEINYSIQQLNEAIFKTTGIRDSVTIEFFSAEEGILDQKSYLQNASQLRFPIAALGKDQNDFVHDWSYHVPGFLVTPPQVLKLMALQAKYLLEFIEYCDHFLSKTTGNHTLRFFLNQMVLIKGAQIDVASGDMTFRIDEYVRPLLRTSPIFRKLVSSQFSDGNGTYKTVLKSNERMNFLAKNVLSRMLSYRPTPKNYFLSLPALYDDLMGDGLQKLDREILESLLTDFIQTKKSDPDFNSKHLLVSSFSLGLETVLETELRNWLEVLNHIETQF